MFKQLAAGLLSCTAAVASAASFAQTPAPMDGLSAFLEAVQDGAVRSPRRYGVQMPEIVSRNGQRRVAPALDVVAGRLDAESCLYQFRLELQWSGEAISEEDAQVGGRSLIQKAPCSTLVQEVVAVATYELSALRRRLHDGGRFALNREREQIIAAARRMPLQQNDPRAALAAVTVDSRVNLRVSPSLKAPVLSKLAPASLVQVTPTASADWYQLQGGPGYLHVSALQSLQPAQLLELPAPVPAAAEDFVAAEVGSAHLSVRDSPSLNGRVIGRLKPGAHLRLQPAPAAGWFELDDGSGFVPEAGLQRVLKSDALVVSGLAVGVPAGP